MDTTVAVWAVTLVLFGHWVADFVWQPHWMGMRKSKEWWVLTQHAIRIGLGSYVVALLAQWIAGESDVISANAAALGWAALNAVAHFAIDAVTSRITGRLYAKGDMHNFFVTIGFDQFLHTAFAVITLVWFVL